MSDPKAEENPDYDPFLDDFPIECGIENPESCESCT